MSDGAQTVVTRVIEVDVKASANAAAQIKEIADRMRPLEEAGKRSADGINTLVNSARGFIALYFGEKVREMVGGFIQLSDSARLLHERMTLVTKNSDDARVALVNIGNTAVNQGQAIEGVAKLYERVVRNSEQMGITQRGAALITEGFAASLRLSGTSAQEATAAMTQFSQSLASGRLQGDEFRSLMENNSVFMLEFAKSVGVSMGQLRQMSKDGELDATAMRNAMLKMGEDGKTMLDRLIERAAKLPQTFAQAREGLEAQFVELLDAMQSLADKSEGFFTKLTKSVTEGLRRATQDIRDYAIIQEEIMKLQGKKADALPSAPFESQRTLKLMESEKIAAEELTRAQNNLNRALETQQNNPNFKLSERFKALNNAVAEAQGRLNGLQRILAEIFGQDSGDTIGGTKAGKPISTPKKATGGLDPLEEMMNSLAKQIESKMGDDLGQVFASDTVMINGSPVAITKLAGKWVEKVWGAIGETKLDTRNPGVRSMIKEMLANAFSLDDQATEQDFQKLIRDALNRDGKRVLQQVEDWDAQFQQELKRLMKEHRKLNPVADEEDESNIIKSIIAGLMDQATANPEMLNEIEGKINKLYELLREINLRAAKKIMGGEKTPEKGIGGQLADEFERQVNRMEDRLLEFKGDWDKILGDMVVSWLRAWAKMELNQSLQPLMQMGKDFIINLFKSGSGSSFGAGGVRAFADGGVVSTPTGFSYGPAGQHAGVMGEAGPEAIMPLRRGADGKLGVGSAPVTVNVINNGSGTKATTTEKTDSKGNREILVLIEDVVNDGIARGAFDKTLAGGFGIQRKGAR